MGHGKAEGATRTAADGGRTAALLQPGGLPNRTVHQSLPAWLRRGGGLASLAKLKAQPGLQLMTTALQQWPGSVCLRGGGLHGWRLLVQCRALLPTCLSVDAHWSGQPYVQCGRHGNISIPLLLLCNTVLWCAMLCCALYPIGSSVDAHRSVHADVECGKHGYTTTQGVDCKAAGCNTGTQRTCAHSVLIVPCTFQVHRLWHTTCASLGP